MTELSIFINRLKRIIKKHRMTLFEIIELDETFEDIDRVSFQRIRGADLKAVEAVMRLLKKESSK